MPSTSPGFPSPGQDTDFLQILPGAPNASLQAVTTFLCRHKRYVAYISGSQLNICTSPAKLIQALSFNDELVTIVAESQTGKIAVAGRDEVYVLEPLTEGWTKVWWEKSLSLRRDDAEDKAQCLSWGSEGEILVGGSRYLSLFSTSPSSRTGSPATSPVDSDDDTEERKALWSKRVASPVHHAAFCPSANVIATCGRYDRLVKIWRRLSFEEGLFDYTYLPHPGAVTHVEWRPLHEHIEERRGSGISGRHEEDPEVLYTIAADGLLRVWRTCGVHEPDILVLYTSIDLVSAIPQTPNGTSSVHRPARYAFTICADHFSAAVTAAKAKFGTKKPSHALEHLSEVSSKSPDITVVMDGQGRMSAWGLQSIGHKRRTETVQTSEQHFHIAHAEDLALKLDVGTNMRVQTWFADSTFHVLAHSFDGHMRWWQGDVEAFFSPSAPGPDRLIEVADCCGHVHKIYGMRAAEDGESLVSWSPNGVLVLWSQRADGSLQQTARIETDEHVFDAFVWNQADRQVVVTIHAKTTALYSADGQRISSKMHGGEAGRDRLRLLPRTDGPPSIIGLGANHVTDPSTFYGKEVPETNGPPSLTGPVDVAEARLISTIGAVGNGVKLLTVDRGGLLIKAVLSTAVPFRDPTSMKDFGSLISSGVQQPCYLEANDSFAALLSSDGKELTIVELKDGYIEHKPSFGERIRCLRWHETSSGHYLLAVAFETSVLVLAQGRYDHHQEQSAWHMVNRISVAGTSVRIFAIEWLRGANMAIAANNGIMVCRGNVLTHGLNVELRDRVDLQASPSARVSLPVLLSKLNETVPAWHPATISTLVAHGKPAVATDRLLRLNEKLKFWSEGERLDSQLDVPYDELFKSGGDYESSNNRLADLIEQLQERDLPATSKSEQERLNLTVQALEFVSEHMNGLDLCSLRYLFNWKLQLLSMNGSDEPAQRDMPNGAPRSRQPTVPYMQWREVAFASHSTTQQPLLDILASHYDNKLTWNMASSLGITAWLSDNEALAQAFEALAQSGYRQTNPPDPINATLFFLALHKKQTLLGLWRIATWHKEQRATMNFLKRDFTQPECRTAAKKNAYALMGKRRFQYAAAFFLLADDASSAVSLLAGQCEDPMLAIAVARLYSGDGSPVMRKLLEERLMPQAEKDGNRWLMSWCHTTLHEKQDAANALVKPLGVVRTWRQDDPTTVVLYRHLREASSKHEYQALLRAARVLRRMGLWLLAVDLVRGWTFRPAALPTPIEPVNNKPSTDAMFNGAHDEPPSMLDGFDEPKKTAVEIPSPAQPPIDEKAARQAKAAELLERLKAKKEVPVVVSEKAQPTQFKEPDANSLLDSFGF